VSRGRLMQQAFGSVTLVSPLIIFHWDSYNNNNPGTFWYHLIWNNLFDEINMDPFQQVRKDSLDGQFLRSLSIQATDIWK
jgi:hypothetical protein